MMDEQLLEICKSVANVYASNIQQDCNPFQSQKQMFQNPVISHTHNGYYTHEEVSYPICPVFQNAEGPPVFQKKDLNNCVSPISYEILGERDKCPGLHEAAGQLCRTR